jgi:PAS domain S-box-containing protein
MGFLNVFEGWPRGRIAVVCCGLAGIVGAVDHVVAGGRLSFTLLYLLPIALASFFVGRIAGVALGAICALLSTLNDPVASKADHLGELGIFLTLGLLAARLREQRAAERAARGDASRSETAIAQARESILITDARGVIRYVNPAFTQTTGYTRQEAVGQNVRLLRSGVHDTAFYRDLWTTILDGRVWRGDMTNKRKDGSVFVERTTIVPVRNESGDISHFIALKEDVTERKPVEKALSESRQQLSAIIESAMDAIVSVGEDGRIMLFNAAAETAFRTSAAQAVGQPLERFVPERFRETLRSQLRSRGEPGAGAPARMTGLRADGEEFAMEFSLSRVAVAGHRILTAILRDVSERRRAEEEQQHLQAALENAAAEWLRTFDAMEDAVVIVDRSDRILRLNRAARDMAGGSYADWLGRKLPELGLHEPWRQGSMLVAEARERGVAVPSQVRNEVDGQSWHVMATSMPDGNDRFILVARDVTQMVELQESVREAETMAAMGALVAGVAHEVRNPLFGISVNVDALAAEVADDKELGEVIGALRREVGRLGVFMENLLEYGKPATVTLSEGPLDAAIDVAIQSCGALASVAGVAVKSGVEPGRWRVRMNRGRLAQVFENLFKNAIQHSPPGAVVTVDVEGVRLHGAHWVRCRIADEGPGFRPEDIPRLFEPFFSRRRGGTGLGLAIVHRIVQEHGGKIHADNRSDGGAVMMVELPCAGG